LIGQGKETGGERTHRFESLTLGRALGVAGNGRISPTLPVKIEARDGRLIARCVGLGLCRVQAGGEISGRLGVGGRERGRKGGHVRQARTFELAQDVEEDIEELAETLENSPLARRAEGCTRQRRSLAHRRECQPIEGGPPEVEEDLEGDAGLREEWEEGRRRGEDDSAEEGGVVRKGGANVFGRGGFNQPLDEAWHGRG